MRGLALLATPYSVGSPVVVAPAARRWLLGAVALAVVLVVALSWLVMRSGSTSTAQTRSTSTVQPADCHPTLTIRPC